MNCPSCGHENIDGIDRCENCLAPFRQLDIPSVDAAESFAQSVMEDNLGRLDYEPSVCVTPDMPAGSVARRMKEANTGCALVLDDGKLVGIFTEHDVLLRMSSAMSNKLQSVESADFQLPNQLPINQIPSSEIPFEELRADEMTVGEETEVDLRIHAGFDCPVAELMSRNPETLFEKDSVAEALNRMSVGRYRHLPVKKSDGSYTVASIKSVLNYIAKEDW